MVDVVACSGTLFEGDFLRERNPIFAVLQGEVVKCLGTAQAGVELRCCF
jgi:hypothetical protein